jgi:DNA-binding NarL/FixJ family response regulator
MENAAKKDSRIGSSFARRKKASDNSSQTKKNLVRVVIADDDPVILKHLAEMLATRFEVVAMSRNGLELLDAVERLSPEIVVADVMMPEMNGLEAVRKIAAASRDVKVLMMSGYKEPAIIEEALNAGASGYLDKIHFFTELFPAIDSLLAGHSYWPSDVWSPPMKVANSE